MSHEPDEPASEEQGRILAVHLGHSANCSSVGSFVDLVFASTVVGGAVVSAIAILLARSADRRRDDASPQERTEDGDES